MGGIIVLLAVILLGPALIFFLIGRSISKKNQDKAKVFYILAVVYLIISLGTCGALLSGV